MANYTYDKLKKEYKSLLTNTEKDREINLQFIRKYNLTKKRDPNRKVPDTRTVYQWYQEITGKRISDWIPEEPEVQVEATAKPEPVEDVKPEPRTTIPDVQNVTVESDEPSSPSEESVSMEEHPPELETPGLDDLPIKKSKGAVKVELGKLGVIIADFENWIYKRWRLRPLTEEERVETTNSVKEVIDNRVSVASKYGDIANVALTVGGHTASRIAESKLGGYEQQQEQQPQPKERNPLDPYPIDPKTGQVIMD